MASDAEVIEAVVGGDADRYAELVNRYQRAAWKLAYGFVGNFEDAKDVSQNGFVKAYRHLKRFRGRAKFSTWLYRIIVNECKDFLKHKARQPRMVSAPLDDPEGNDPILFDVADSGGDPSDCLANQELAKALQAAISELAGNQRTAFLLRHVNGLSLEEASAVMGCRVGTVKAHVFRALEHLRIRLSSFVNREGRRWAQQVG